MRVVVGRVGRAQGIRGEVTVEVRTDAPEERFSPGALLYPVGGTGYPASLTVAGYRWQGTRLILALAGITDRTAAEALRGALLEAEVDVTAAEQDEYHDALLVGMAVVDPTGTELGTVDDVLHLPGQDLLAVRRQHGPELLVPFVRALVPEVDVPARRIVVDLPPGLADLGP